MARITIATAASASGRRSVVSVFDNECILPSPCIGCHWHVQRIDKNRCVRICQRLKAYREEEAYDHLPYPVISELQNVERETKKICEICKIEGRTKFAKVRGLCINDYTRWHGGRVNHPTYGAFVRKKV